MKKLLLLFVTILLLSCGGKGLKIHRGDIVHISDDCVGCYTEKDLDKVIDAANSRSSQAFASALATTDYVYLTKGRAVTVRQIKVGKVKVELLNGDNVWVMYKHIKD